MKKIILTIVISVSLLEIYSCSQQLPICESTLGLEIKDERTMRYYSAKDDIWYDFSNDKEFITISIATSNKRVQRRIFEQGIKLYFSPEKKPNLTRYLQYPAPNSQELPPPPDDEFASENSNMFIVSSKKALWINSNKAQVISLDSAKIDTKIDFKPSGKNGILFSVKIPVQKVAYTKNSIILGIVIDGHKKPNKPKSSIDNEPMDMNTTPNGMNRGMQGGGMGNNIGVHGGRGGHKGGHRYDEDKQEHKGKDKTEIWNKVLLP